MERVDPGILSRALGCLLRQLVCGGDTNTNEAICGAVLGAGHGREAISVQWTKCLSNCRPAAGQAHVRHPRPECFWPADVLSPARVRAKERRNLTRYPCNQELL